MPLFHTSKALNFQLRLYAVEGERERGVLALETCEHTKLCGGC